MIERYSRKELRSIWQDYNKYSIWLKIELAAAEAMEKYKIIPRGITKKIKSKSKINVKRILNIESKVKHDVIAFLTSITEKAGNDARYLHPINSHKFHQFIFNIKYANSLIRNYESFSFMNKEIKIENIYPSLGILRLKFLFTKLYKNNNNDLENIAIPEIILNFKSINFAIIILNISNLKIKRFYL